MAYNQFPEHPDDSVGGWMLTLLLMGLPLAGFDYLLVLALGSDGSPAKRNFARAALIWQIICALVAVLFFVLFGAAIMASLPDSSLSRRTASVLVGATSESLGCRPHIVWGFTLPSEHAQHV